MSDLKHAIVIITADQVDILPKDKIAFLALDLKRALLIDTVKFEEYRKDIFSDETVQVKECEDTDIDVFVDLFTNCKGIIKDDIIVLDYKAPEEVSELENTTILVRKHFSQSFPKEPKKSFPSFKHNNTFANRPVSKHSTQNWKHNRRIMK